MFIVVRITLVKACYTILNETLDKMISLYQVLLGCQNVKISIMLQRYSRIMRKGTLKY